MPNYKRKSSTNFRNADRSARQNRAIKILSVKFPQYFRDSNVKEKKAKRPLSKGYHRITSTGMRSFEQHPPKEGEWDRVQRMRREGHYLIRGDHYRDPKKNIPPYQTPSIRASRSLKKDVVE